MATESERVVLETSAAVRSALVDIVSAARSAVVDIAPVRDSRLVTVVGNIPIDEFADRVSSIVRLADSVQVTVRGDGKRAASVISRLGAEMDVVSTKVTLRRGGAAQRSMRGDEPVDL